jgi:hypothetical protein
MMMVTMVPLIVIRLGKLPKIHGNLLGGPLDLMEPMKCLPNILPVLVRDKIPQIPVGFLRLVHEILVMIPLIPQHMKHNC